MSGFTVTMTSKRFLKLIGLTMMDSTVVIPFGKSSGMQSSKVTIYLCQML